MRLVCQSEKKLHNKAVVLDIFVSSILPEKFGALKFNPDSPSKKVKSLVDPVITG